MIDYRLPYLLPVYTPIPIPISISIPFLYCTVLYVLDTACFYLSICLFVDVMCPLAGWENRKEMQKISFGVSQKIQKV